MSNKFDDYYQARVAGSFPAEAARKACVSPGMTTKYEARLRRDLPCEEYAKIQTPFSKQRVSKLSENGNKAELQNAVRELKLQIEGLKKERQPFLAPGLKPTRKGYAAELYVRYCLTRQGLTYLDPPEDSEALDLVVFNGLRYYRCEIKGTTREKVSISRTLRYPTTNVCSRYTKEDLVDFFILVDLINEYLFVVPAGYIVENNRKEVTLTIDSEIWKFKDQFELLRN